MLTEKEVAAINSWLDKGFEIEIYRKPDGTLNIKTVRKKRLIVNRPARASACKRTTGGKHKSSR